MLKKITGMGIIGLVIIIITMMSFSNNSIGETKLIVKGDVMMPISVSRPGCEESDRCYIPSLIEIKKGQQVTWVNEDSAFHSVTSGFYGAPSDLFDSGHLDPFESYTVFFNETGTFDYFCTLHPWMKGKVIVK